MGKKYAFVKYTKKGQLIPGSLVITEGYPKETANGVWEEVPMNLFCCEPISQRPPSLILKFSSLAGIYALIPDPSDVNDWNSLFDLPNYGNPFTSVIFSENQVSLIGGSDITIRSYLFDNSSLLEINDEVNCIIAIEQSCFYFCDQLTLVNLPLLTSIPNYAFSYTFSLQSIVLPLITYAGSESFSYSGIEEADFPLLDTIYFYCFYACSNLTTVNLPSLTNASSGSFSFSPNITTINLPSCTNLGATVGDDGVFYNIIGNDITLTVPSSLMTINGGNPDGDIVYLQNNNTVTIITV